LTVKGPAEVTYACYNNSTHAITVSGYVEVDLVPEASGAGPPTVAIAAVGGLAAVSYLASQRKEALLAALAPIAGRIKRVTAAENPLRKEILKLLDGLGAATMAQIAKALGASWGSVQWHLYVLEREGRVRSIKLGPFQYFFTNPRAAAKVILESVDPSLLSLEDREKLDLLASMA
jgi:DNA-binding transcriptional ArsR family regulator